MDVIDVSGPRSDETVVNMSRAIGDVKTSCSNFAQILCESL